MAASTKLLIIFFSLFADFADGERTNKKIYLDLVTKSYCVRHFNATHAVGCTSNYDGNVGTVHYFTSDDDFDWVLKSGPHPPYIAVLEQKMFTGENVLRLRESHGRVNGLMVITLYNDTSHPTPKGFSSVDKCPNSRSGMYNDHPNYNCKDFNWNPYGSGLHFQDLGMPTFALTDPEDVDTVINKCFNKFNKMIDGKPRDYPVCAAEIKSMMFGAVDSRTCMRRSERIVPSLTSLGYGYCDPLGDKNIVSFLKDTNNTETRANNSVIVMATRMDASGMFQGQFPGAATAAVGFITQLMVAKALGTVAKEMRGNSSNKDIMFAFLQGETFDYLGSSRMVYDMEGGNFPEDSPKSGHVYTSPVRLSHINQIVELNQVAGGQLYLHTDPLSAGTPGKPVYQEVQDMIKSLVSLASTSVDLNIADQSIPLPPASAQRFLRKRANIPTVVVTDHEKEFNNNYYNSRLDMYGNLDMAYPANMSQEEKYDHVTTQARRVANLSLVLAKYLYTASTGQAASQEIIDKFTAVTTGQSATNLLYCYLVYQACPLFSSLVDSESDLKANIESFTFYVGVTNGPENFNTQFTQKVMSMYFGTQLAPNTSLSECKDSDTDKRYSYTWNYNASACYKSLTTLTKAESPAWDIEGYDFLSGEFPTWTESRWGSKEGVRVFLIPSQQFQVSLLVTGVVVFVFSLVLVYLANSRRGILFGTALQASGEPNTSIYNPMT